MTRFNAFTDDELDAMESAFCNEGLKYLVDEIRRERRYREKECNIMELNDLSERVEVRKNG